MVLQTRIAQECCTSSFLRYLKIEKRNGVAVLQAYMLMYAMVLQTRKAQECCTSSFLRYLSTNRKADNGVVVLQAYMLMYAMYFYRLEKHKSSSGCLCMLFFIPTVSKNRKAQRCCSSSGLYAYVCYGD